MCFPEHINGKKTRERTTLANIVFTSHIYASHFFLLILERLDHGTFTFFFCKFSKVV